MAQNIKYRYCEPGETIFKTGDKGDCWYIVMKGRIQLTIPEGDFKVVRTPREEDLVEEEPEEKEEGPPLWKLDLKPEEVKDLTQEEQARYYQRQ